MKKYDVFISHAYEDKSSFSNELAVALKKAGLKIWYSGFDLKIGDSIAESINRALQDARFGIVIISPVYLRKKWAMNELHALFASETSKDRILPVYHNISQDEVLNHFPLIADRFAINSDVDMQLIVNKLLQVIQGKRKYTRKKKPTEATEKNADLSAAPKGETNVTGNQGFIALGNMTFNAKQVAGGNIVNTTKKKKK